MSNIQTLQPITLTRLTTWQDAFTAHLQDTYTASATISTAQQHINVFTKWFEDTFNQPFNPDGSPNPAYQAYKKEERRAGAAGSPVVNVNTATKPFLNAIGQGAGEAVNTAFTGAQAAVQTLNNVDQIRSGLKSIITGPGANVRIQLSQVGELLGINGKDATEQLQNTRAAIQGLARQELAAAGSMKGQGQITESERGILKRAESGEITDLTKPEIVTLLGALEKTANYRIGLHESNMKRLESDPNVAGVVEFMRVQRPPRPAPSPADVRSQADAILGRK